MKNSTRGVWSSLFKLDFTPKDVLNFLSAHLIFYYDKYIGLPTHVKKQIDYRLDICSQSCLIYGECESCGCYFGSNDKHVGKEYQIPPCSGNKYPRLFFRKSKYKEAIKNGLFKL